MYVLDRANKWQTVVVSKLISNYILKNIQFTHSARTRETFLKNTKKPATMKIAGFSAL